MLADIYSPGQSFVHKTRPMVKIATLFVTCTMLFIWESWLSVFVVGTTIASLYWIAKISLNDVYRSLKPVAWVLILIFLLQLYLEGINLAGFVVLRFLIMIMAASLLTLTTRTNDLISALEVWLGRFLPEKVSEDISLAFSLCFRFIPMVRNTFGEVQEAQRVRRHSHNWRALVTPTVVRTLKSADDISQAITARSVDTHHLSNREEKSRY